MKTLPPQILLRKISKQATKAITTYQMIAADDKLLVGLSGGNDSMVLMHVLYDLQRRAPFPFTIHAVTVDAGFDGINLSPLSAYCQSQGWSHEIIPFEGKELIAKHGAETQPCALCARVRRGLLHRYADEHGFNKIVLGHHLDDICVSFLMSLFHGQGLTTMGPNVPAEVKNTAHPKRLIRPLAFLEKVQIDALAEQLELPVCGECDYAQHLEAHGDRARLERLVAQLNGDFPGIRKAMLKSLSDVRPDYLLDLKFLNFANPVPKE